jgi:hypothetical protein
LFCRKNCVMLNRSISVKCIGRRGFNSTMVTYAFTTDPAIRRDRQGQRVSIAGSPIIENRKSTTLG